MHETFESISRIHDMFEAWRSAGCQKLDDGTELLVAQHVDGEECWMHAVFPRLTSARLAEMESLLETKLEPELRRFYGACGGVTLFGGLFRIHGLPRHRGVIRARGVEVADIAILDHGLTGCPWKPASAIAVGTSEWDGSIYLANMGDSPEEIVRVQRATGAIIERSASIWTLVAERLYRLDGLLEATA